MFSSPRFLAYINKPSVYYLRRPLTLETRKQILKQLESMTRNQLVSKSNPLYKPAYEMNKQQRIDQIQKYENSFLWSPEFTPKRFMHLFVLPIIASAIFILFLHYVATPRRLMELKLKFGIRFPQMEKMGFLDGWYQEYIKKDKVLQFQMQNLRDLERLYKQGMLAKNESDTIKKIEKKKSKFVRGNRNFILNEFKTN